MPQPDLAPALLADLETLRGMEPRLSSVDVWEALLVAVATLLDDTIPADVARDVVDRRLALMPVSTSNPTRLELCEWLQDLADSIVHPESLEPLLSPGTGAA